MHLRAAILLALAAIPAFPRHLPIQIFTTAQGLPRNSVRCMTPGRTGLIWLCTTEGLARFDGYRFRLFGPDEGLPSRRIIDLVPSRQGGYWVVTDRGICRLAAESRIGERCQVLTAEPREGVYTGDYNTGSIVESSTGETWVATTHAVFRVSSDARRLERLPIEISDNQLIATLVESPRGSLLIVTDKSIFEWRPGDAQRKITDFGGDRLLSISPAEMWVVGRGLSRLRFQDGATSVETYSDEPFRNFSSLLKRRDGTLWAAGSTGWGRSGLWRIEAAPDGRPRVLESFSQADGFPEAAVSILVEDAHGSMWGATDAGGIFHLQDAGFISYYGEDGLGSARIGAILEDRTGRLLVGAPMKDVVILSWQNGRFQPIPLRHPRSQTYFGWGWNQTLLPASAGDWWWAAGASLLHYPKLERAEDLSRVEPVAYTAQSPLGCSDVFRVAEDSSGDIWVTCLVPANFTARWDRKTGQFHRLTSADGWPDPSPALVIREGPAGHLWLGTWSHAVRFRNGRFEAFTLTPGQLNPTVRDLMIDHAGRVWIATARAGVFRCDNPEDPAPVFRAYNFRNGLSSEATSSLVEDNSGFIYVGTARGVDRIDPKAPFDSRRIRHFTIADGLPDSEQNVAFRDSRGHLWFGSLHGLAEFDPTRTPHSGPPPVYITRVRVRGEDTPLPWEGATANQLRLAADRNQAEIEYATLDLRAANSQRYQYRMAGVDARWSDPVEQLSVNYASLPRGTLRFEVRAVDAEGQVSAQAAQIDLFVQYPLWQRWWFVLMVASLGVAAIVLAYNYRVRQLLAIERLRTRIATDLHDDMGANLTQISILSELARKGGTPQVLSDIAEIARGMVGDMSDIVWAISPQHDSFEGLVGRMRRFAEDTLGGRNIDLEFHAEVAAGESAVPLEVRRPLYLVFKEAVNNIARHSRSRNARIRMVRDRKWLILTVEDDGVGFEVHARHEGEGLASISRRLRDIGGTPEWVSQPGKGTRLTAAFPLSGAGLSMRGAAASGREIR